MTLLFPMPNHKYVKLSLSSFRNFKTLF